jgi:hypothetical protein
MGKNNVYVFNTTTSALTLTLNGYPLSGMNAATETGLYVPVQSTVPRNPAVGPSTNVEEFGENNSLVIGYTSFHVAYKFAIDNIGYPEIEKGEDLQLYIFRKKVVVVSASKPQDVEGESPSQNELDAVLEGGASEGEADDGAE